jgi:hypothetical protein
VWQWLRTRRWPERNATIAVVVTAVLASLLGFAYGNYFERRYSFDLKDWQTLLSAMVAFLGVALAYMGVRGTQRINVLIKEQDRIAELLPGLRQVDEALAIPRSVLAQLRHRYQAHILLDAAFKQQDGEWVEDVVRRKLPLADDHLKWEVARIVFALKTQAKILQVGHDEVERNQTDVANIQTFAQETREGLLETARRVEQSHEREDETMGTLIAAFNVFAQSIKQRISKAEARKNTIQGVIDQFFES